MLLAALPVEDAEAAEPDKEAVELPEALAVPVMTVSMMQIDEMFKSSMIYQNYQRQRQWKWRNCQQRGCCFRWRRHLWWR